MHAIRSRARKAAWSAGEGIDGKWARFIPWAARNAGQSREFDPETAHHSHIASSDAHSETCVDDQHTDTQDFDHHPHHATTAPPGASSIENSPVEPTSHHHFVNSMKYDTSSADLEKHKQETHTSPLSDTTTQVGSPQQTWGSTKRRRGDKVKKFLPFMNRQKDNEDDKKYRKQKNNKFAESDKKLTLKSQLFTVLGNWINVLLLCVPAGIAIGNIDSVNGIAVFVVNFIAIIPLAGMLSYATEEIAMRVGETLGGLLNASFGNAVELIVAIIALADDQILIVQTSLIGSMFSNLLLVMGMCFYFGGLGKLEQYFNVTVAQTAASLLALAIGSLLVPTFFDQGSNNAGTEAERARFVPALSRGVAVILLVVYGCYLTFQLRTHANIFNETGGDARRDESKQNYKEGSISRGIAKIGAGSAATAGGQVNQNKLQQDKPKVDEDEEETPKLTFWFAILTLCVATALVGVTSDYMVKAIPVLNAAGVSPEFTGLILLPIVGNAAEHATAVTVAIKDKMDLAIGVAVGSSLQIALFVLPISVIIGWGLASAHPEYTFAADQIMTLEFDVFQIGLLFVTVILVNYLIQDGASHWLEGVLLMSMYVMIAVAAWFYPAGSEVAG